MCPISKRLSGNNSVSPTNFTLSFRLSSAAERRERKGREKRKKIEKDENAENEACDERKDREREREKGKSERERE